MSRLAVDWRPIEPPRVPVAALADGPNASGLALSTTRLVAHGADLRAAVGGGALLVLGEPEVLPWTLGVTYLGRDNGLLLPTTLEPTIPVDLLDTALRQLMTHHGVRSRLVAVLPGRVLSFDVSDTQVDPNALRRHAAEAFA